MTAEAASPSRDEFLLEDEDPGEALLLLLTPLMLALASMLFARRQPLLPPTLLLLLSLLLHSVPLRRNPWLRFVVSTLWSSLRGLATNSWARRSWCLPVVRLKKTARAGSA